MVDLIQDAKSFCDESHFQEVYYVPILQHVLTAITHRVGDNSGKVEMN